MPSAQEHTKESATKNEPNLIVNTERTPLNLLSVDLALIVSQLTSPRDPQPITEVHVTSLLGQKQSFKIHKNFLCYHHAFFDAAFNGKSTEGESKALELNDTHHEVFGIFINWLYMQENHDKIRL